MLKYFKGTYTLSHLSLIIGVAIGYAMGFNIGGVAAGLGMALSVAILAVLEISVSFDNAIINAKVLSGMSKVWQQRFITFGIPIAVVGMRLVFPIAIVAIATGLSMTETVNMAMFDSEAYHHALEGSRTGIFLFGGAFLMMVALDFFTDADKDNHWLFLERFMSHKNSSLLTNALIVSSVVLMALTTLHEESLGVKIAAYGGVVLYALINLVDNVLATQGVKNGFIGFLYLEVLDASFSFDGVISAFAISSDIFVIMIGLGIGAMYVRSMTISLVENETLQEYRYLEHAAMWAILFLSIIMFVSVFVEVPEIVTGLVGVSLIGAGYIHSNHLNKKERQEKLWQL